MQRSMNAAFSLSHNAQRNKRQFSPLRANSLSHNHTECRPLFLIWGSTIIMRDTCSAYMVAMLPPGTKRPSQPVPTFMCFVLQASGSSNTKPWKLLHLDAHNAVRFTAWLRRVFAAEDLPEALDNLLLHQRKDGSHLYVNVRESNATNA